MGGSKSREKGRPVDLTPTEFKGLRGNVATGLGQFTNPAFSSLQDNFQAGPVAGLGQGEIAALNQVGTARLDPAALQANQRFLDSNFLDVGSDPNVQGAIDAATRRVFQGAAQAGRDATSAFVNAGQSPGQSSPFAREAGRIQRESQQVAGDIASQIIGGEFARRQQIQANAIGTAQRQQAFELQRQLETLQAQGLPRLVQELGIERGIQEFQRQQGQLMEGLQLAVAATSPTVAQKTDSSRSGGGVLSGG